MSTYLMYILIALWIFCVFVIWAVASANSRADRRADQRRLKIGNWSTKFMGDVE